jgi:uncharacterized membrane protein HdeD (DUF308 family)
MTDIAVKNVANTTRILRMPGQTTLVSGILFIAMGGVFIAWGMSDPVTIFTPILGCIFVVFGLFSLIRGSSMARSSRRSREL